MRNLRLFTIILFFTIYNLIREYQSHKVINSSISFCGEWIPYDKYTLTTDTFPLSSSIPKCPTSKVGKSFYPNSSKLFCNPNFNYSGRLSSILALDLMRERQTTRPEYAIVSPSYNAEDVIRASASKICNTTVGLWEIVFVLDFPQDSSLETLKDVLTSDICLSNYGLLRARIIVQPSPVFETSSDNIAFSLMEIPTNFYIEIQADMMVEQKGWNFDLSRPILEFNDIFAVSGRCGLSYGEKLNHVGRCGPDFGYLNASLADDTLDAFYITDSNNRGPIIYRADVLHQLGYYNEVNFYLEGDDYDLNIRARNMGWFVGYKYSAVYAPLHLSPRRNVIFRKKLGKEARATEAEARIKRLSFMNVTCMGKMETPTWFQFPIKHSLRVPSKNVYLSPGEKDYSRRSVLTR